MAITLSDGVNSIELAQDLHWSDEFDWSPIIQSTTHSLGGRPFVNRRTSEGLRPLSLIDDDGAWMSRSDIIDLYDNWLIKGTVDAPLTLTLHDAREFSVIWNYESGALDAAPALPGLSDPVSTSEYAVGFRFLIIEQLA
jgi:hypothetical protein